MPQLIDTGLVWFRRDLRSFDHAALSYALDCSRRLYCVFIFDREILDSLPRADRRVEFIHACIIELDAELRQHGGGMIVRHAFAESEIPKLAAELCADAVFVNHDYEPAAIRRDAAVAASLAVAGRAFFSFKDQVIFEKNEVLSQSARPFSVFTPYKNAWVKNLHLNMEANAGLGATATFDTTSLHERLVKMQPLPIPTLSELGFEKTNLSTLNIPTGMQGGQLLFDDFLGRIGQYGNTRDFPAAKGPSYLSIHLRFGTVSIRGLVRRALDALRAGDGSSGASIWLNELIWREFYATILFHHAHVIAQAFKPSYDLIEWQIGAEADAHFEAWCEGRTGYPLVDAAMAQLNQTGYMHNRLRMVSACFLIKDLGIDWRRGEQYFSAKLNDYDLASNNGGWQWAASSGCDAQPYFRIFNPITQSEKFDSEGKFIRRYLPQLAKLPNKAIHAPWRLTPAELSACDLVLGQDYPHPIVEHDQARKATLARYGIVRTVKNEIPPDEASDE
jgi:deoxyribodipyrimidine photo-lyase